MDMESHSGTEPTPPPVQGWRRVRERLVRRILPRSLLGRMLLIGFIPLLATQAISLELFYGNYLQIVSRRLSGDMATTIAMTIDLLERYPSPADRQWILDDAGRRAGLTMTLHEGERLDRRGSNHVLGPIDDDLVRDLRANVRLPSFVDWKQARHRVVIRVQTPIGVLQVVALRKRLDVAPVWLFVAWASGSALVLFLIAALFMRNQVRAIRRLARAAQLFGLGRDTVPIVPEGAQEIRKAAVAFNRMRDRINRFVEQRTTVLAGVSHDLRTPLTRLRLSLAMLPRTGMVDAAGLQPDIADMIGDIVEMEHMIEGYLSFARGEGAEKPVVIRVEDLFDEIVAAQRRMGAQARIGSITPMGLSVTGRGNALRRVLNNVVENARRHATRIELSAERGRREVFLYVDDNGCGVEETRRESVFRPFESGKEGGTGLGLAIARDIIHAHGGHIALEAGPLGGARVRIVLPN
ncbi:two component sensor histidine kinase EnvZ [Komagataeibacter europaeus NBRC 3261]|uniref:histidine kinase n=1 Tax=Komagataeibacter europaeus NBRC 3261 TaxID=1234669 RepID=A0A0D6PY56_KOMEU|nr:HAMP domain-containing sensor histidine kinase [Komagataeibacter europaeus]GAN95973.1 two component sensor histidine kinase EnvZ [Komagataeibacter europaeus NBRC 3261]